MKEDNQEIKKVYEELSKIENIYVMPISVYNAILNKLGHLEDYLKQTRKSRDMWKKRYYDSKNKDMEIKKSKAKEALKRLRRCA